MGNTTYCATTQKASSKSTQPQQPTQACFYVSNKEAPAHHEQKTAEKMTQLKQPKKAALFQAKKSTTPAAPSSEVDRIIAGMQRNA